MKINNTLVTQIFQIQIAWPNFGTQNVTIYLEHTDKTHKLHSPDHKTKKRTSI
jgi:hypothetical protein